MSGKKHGSASSCKIDVFTEVLSNVLDCEQWKYKITGRTQSVEQTNSSYLREWKSMKLPPVCKTHFLSMIQTTCLARTARLSSTSCSSFSSSSIDGAGPEDCDASTAEEAVAKLLSSNLLLGGRTY